MLKFFVFGLLWVGSVAHAQNLCAESTCNDQQAKIQKAFDELPQFSSQTLDGVYSGTCYHNWPSLDPARAQFAMSVVEKTDSATTLNSIFNFFSAEDPYAKMDLAQAKKEFERDNCKAYPVNVTPTLAYQIIRSSQGTIEYWVHSNGNDYYLLGAWKLKTGQVRSWCHLTRNP